MRRARHLVSQRLIVQPHFARVLLLFVVAFVSVALLALGHGCLLCDAFQPDAVSLPTRHVALMTLFAGYPLNVTDAVTANRQRYCDAHGLECILSWERVSSRCDSFEPLNEALPKAWGKVHALRACLPHFRRIAWIDADAMICNFRTTVDSVFQETPSPVIVSGNDCNPHPNSGVILLERGNAAVHVLDSILALERDEAFVRGAYWHEQSAIMHLLKEPRSAPHIAITRSTLQWFPSQDNKCMPPHPTSWVAHWAGCGGDPLCFRDIIIWPTFAYSPPGKYNMSMFEDL